MTIHEHEDLLRAARAQARTARFKQDYPTRSNIERTIAHTATQNGRRIKLRYLGGRCANHLGRACLAGSGHRLGRGWV